MEKTRNKYIYILLNRTLSVIFTMICAIVFPQIFHLFGVTSGLGDKVGQMFLPMYLPVLILAFKTNAVTGMIAGILSPVISFAISGMPTISMLPFITIELACYGIFAGLFSQKKMNIFVKIFMVQLLSKIVRILAILILGCFYADIVVSATAVLSSVVLALPGYVLQLLAVPYFVKEK